MQVGQYGRTLAGAPCRVEGEQGGFPLVRLWNPFSEKMTTIMVAEFLPDPSARRSLELHELREELAS